MNRRRPLWMLKLACAATALVAAALFFGAAPPVIARALPDGSPRFGARFWADLAYIWIIGVLCLTALREAWTVCTAIGAGNAFSERNARALLRIARRMAAACALLFAGLVYLVATRGGQTDPLLAGLMGLGVCAGLILALCAAAAADLIRAGTALKEENDLTI